MKLSKNDDIKLTFATKYSYNYLFLIQRELQYRWELQRFQKHFGHGKTTSHRKGKIEKRLQEIKSKVYFIRSVIQLKKNLEDGFLHYDYQTIKNSSITEFLNLKKHNIYLKWR